MPDYPARAMLLFLMIQLAAVRPVAAAKLHINVGDEQMASLPCRVHLKNQQGRPLRAAGQPFWRDHFVCSGDVTLDVEPGIYEFLIERGPEYERRSGTFTVHPNRNDAQHFTLPRIAKLRELGWYSGDLHVHRPIADVELLMQAEDLDFAPVITWWNDANPWKQTLPPSPTLKKFDGHRLYDVMAGEDEREGGALLYFGLGQPLDLAGSRREVPSPMLFVNQAEQRNPKVWIDIEKPFWWDVPVWLASGRMNSIGIANNHMCHSQMLADEAWGKPRDADRLPAPLGNGYWTQEIYYHILNSGLRLPPSAGSASGVLPNPVGYNRVYVHLDVPFTRDAWFDALARGRCFVTNGPLVLVKANDELPGAVFQLADGKPLRVELEIQLTSKDPIRQLEVIQNGALTKTINCAAEVTQQHSLELTVEEPGWFLVRAIADVDNTFRFASTAPWYIESPQQGRRISRRSAQFFLDWVDERIRRVRNHLENGVELQQVLQPHESAREFWQKRIEDAQP